MNIPLSLGPIPKELLENYTPQQLSDALITLIITDLQDFAQEVRKIDAWVKDKEEAEDGFTPFPRLSTEQDAEVKAVLNGGAAVIAQVRLSIAALSDLRSKAAAVRMHFQKYADEVKSVLQSIEGSPRG